MYKYKNQTVVNAITNEKIELPPNVEKNKLFYGDTFVIDESNKIVITSSTIRQASEFPAVLCLRNNRTYGKQGTKHLYKCVPDNKHLPPFLVPYEMKQIGFSKVFSNKYVLIKFVSWNELNPRAMLTNVIGDVDVLDNYYEYQLYCKGLAISIQSFIKQTNNPLMTPNNNIGSPKGTSRSLMIPCFKEGFKGVSVAEYLGSPAITIDPEGTRDFDDAFSIVNLPEGKTKISVHIANVTSCLDTNQLWDYVKRVSTIYLPNKSKPMLPPRLSEEICSLVQGKTRNVLTMEVILDSDTGNVITTDFYCNQIVVLRNYVYEEPDLLALSEYQQLFQLTNKLQHITDSHELVAFWMGKMNTLIAEKMYNDYSVGIFRRATLTNNDVLPLAVKNWKNAVCEYVPYQNEIKHELLGVDKYLHITSPIRRIVDLINMTLFLSKIGTPITEKALQFCNNWIDQIDYINDKIRAIRKVQTQCSLLAMCSIGERIECDAYLFDKKSIDECTNMFHVYLKSLNLMYKLKTTDLTIQSGDTRKVQLVMFSDEDSLKKKIRLQIVCVPSISSEK